MRASIKFHMNIRHTKCLSFSGDENFRSAKHLGLTMATRLYLISLKIGRVYPSVTAGFRHANMHPARFLF